MEEAGIYIYKKKTPSITGRRNHGVSWPRDFVCIYVYLCMGGGGLICLDASLLHKDTTGDAFVLLFILAIL